MFDSFKKDYYRNTGRKWSFFRGLIAIVTERRIRYLLYLRILNNEKLKLLHPICNIGRLIISRFSGIEIPKGTAIGNGFRMVHP